MSTEPSTVAAPDAPAGPAPWLSIVIATWNAARTLERCLASAIGQTEQDLELLIADGGSTDGTVAILQEHSARIAWWQSRRDGGIYDAWNQALAHARGRYVCFLGADDAWSSPMSVATLRAAERGIDYDLVTSRGRVLDPATGSESVFGEGWDYCRLGRHMVVCHPGLLHRRELFDHYGVFDTRYRIAGDLDFLLRLPRSIRTLHIDTVTVDIEAAGVSRRNVMQRLREQRLVLSRSPRHGSMRAWLAWLDKLWRYPLARLLGLPH